MPSLRQTFIFGVFLIFLGIFALVIHPFLAETKRAEADILVVEGWVADEILSGAAEEFKQGHYTLLLTSGLEFESGDSGQPSGSYASRAAEKLSLMGIAPSVIWACPTPLVGWHRTSNSARAVRAMLDGHGVRPKGINVVTAGPHARETWVAYQRVMKASVPVGVISIPNKTYDATRWWTTRQGRYWVIKNLAGWTKELLFGQRS